MHPGERWAYRERANDPGCQVIPVELIRFGPSMSQRVRVRVLDGEFADLEQWVIRRRLIVRWDDRAAWLADERRLLETIAASPTSVDPLNYDVVTFILPCHPVTDAFLLDLRAGERTVVRIPDPGKVLLGLGFDQESVLARPHVFQDRNGTVIGPWELVLDLAHAMTRIHSAFILAEVAREQAELEDAAIYGRDYKFGHVSAAHCADDLRIRRPVFEQVRQWCDAGEVARFDEAAALREEIERLRDLVVETARWLKDRGHHHRSRVIREAIGLPGVEPVRRLIP
jgi:hypothetical protein